jgi:hypothetical protein
MALDVYVGSLARYYAGEWESIAEKAARERGAPFRIARPGGPDRPKGPQTMQAAIETWRLALSTSLGSSIARPLDWDDTLEAPYFTGRPGWDGFGSLVLWAAYAEHPSLRQPDNLPEEWDNDPALIRSNAAGFRSRYSHLVRNVELWLPSPFEFTFEGEDVDRRRVVVGSTLTLRRQLDELNGATWKAGAVTIAQWSREPPADDAALALCARYAFAILFELSRQAAEHRLPMKLDY